MREIYEPSEFKSLKYDVINIKGPVLKAHRGLANIKSFAECTYPDKEKVIRLICLFYDKNSPLTRLFKDLELRWKEAAKLAGFDLVDDEARLIELYEFSPERQIGETDPDDEEAEPDVILIPAQIENMATDFLIDQGDLYWAMTISNLKTFFEFQKAAQQIVVSFSSDKDKLSAIAAKAKLLEESERIAERLEGYFTKVFRDSKLIEKGTKKAMTPEAIASRKNV